MKYVFAELFTNTKLAGIKNWKNKYKPRTHAKKTKFMYTNKYVRNVWDLEEFCENQLQKEISSPVSRKVKLIIIIVKYTAIKQITLNNQSFDKNASMRSEKFSYSPYHTWLCVYFIMTSVVDGSTMFETFWKIYHVRRK